MSKPRPLTLRSSQAQLNAPDWPDNVAKPVIDLSWFVAIRLSAQPVGGHDVRFRMSLHRMLRLFSGPPGTGSRLSWPMAPWPTCASADLERSPLPHVQLFSNQESQFEGLRRIESRITDCVVAG